MRRRAFLALAGTSAAAALLPLRTNAQQHPTAMIGILIPASPPGGGAFASSMAEFQAGLRSLGFEENQNVKIEYAWAGNNFDRLPALLSDFIDQKVNVIVPVGGAPSLLAAKAATSTIPIVFANGTDPVKLGIVESLNRPGGNITGATFFGSDLGPKRLELVRLIIPKASRIAVLMNPKNQNSAFDTENLQQAAQNLHLQIKIMHVSNAHDIDATFDALSQQRPDALLIDTELNLFQST